MTPIPPEITIDQLVPHAGRMRLLDRAVEVDDERIVATVEIRPGGLFYDPTGVGAWVGLEYMAQAVAAWAGWHARLRGEKPMVGYLLGTRCYQCSVPRFAPGASLTITACRVFQADNGLGQFDCRIDVEGSEVASATLTVYQPEQARRDVNPAG